MSLRALSPRLATYRLPLELGEAARYLRNLCHVAQIAALYRHYFPAEWAASLAVAQRDPLLAWEFFDLLNAHLFPVDGDRLEWELDESDGWPDVVPMDPCAFALDEDGDYSTRRLAWQMLAVLAGTSLDNAVEIVDSPWEGALVASAAHLDWEVFTAHCTAAGAPLAQAPLALDMITHETGNSWLDLDIAYEILPFVELTIEEIDEAAQAAREARALREQVTPLLDWLEADPAHLEELIALWNQSRTTMP